MPRQKKVTKTRGIKQPSVLIGQVFSRLRVIGYTEERSNGHRLVIVEDTKTGVRKKVRSDNLKAGRTTSDGSIKKQRYLEHKERGITMREMDLDEFEDNNPEVIEEARRLTGEDVDSRTGKKVANIKKNRLWETSVGKRIRTYYLKSEGHLMLKSWETYGSFAPVSDEIENGGKITGYPEAKSVVSLIQRQGWPVPELVDLRPDEPVAPTIIIQNATIHIQAPMSFKETDEDSYWRQGNKNFVN